MLCQIQTIQYGPKWMQIYNCKAITVDTQTVCLNEFYWNNFFSILLIDFASFGVWNVDRFRMFSTSMLAHHSNCTHFNMWISNEIHGQYKIVSYIRIKIDRTINSALNSVCLTNICVCLSKCQNSAQIFAILIFYCISASSNEFSSLIDYFHTYFWQKDITQMCVCVRFCFIYHRINEPITKYINQNEIYEFSDK